jgi:hypothetical protein
MRVLVEFNVHAVEGYVMDRSNRLQRFAHLADMALSAIVLPIIIVGAMVAGHVDAALTFAGMLIGGALIYRFSRH